MIFVALGSNLTSIYGSPEETIEAAKLALAMRGVDVVRSSRVWVTEPVPKSDQPLYRNAVIEVDTDLPACDLLALLHGIEQEFGRIRLVQNEARPLDLDLLIYHKEVIDDADIHVPHPRMHERAFVLVPLSEIVGQVWQHPVLKKTVREMLNETVSDDAMYPLKKDAA